MTLDFIGIEIMVRNIANDNSNNNTYITLLFAAVIQQLSFISVTALTSVLLFSFLLLVVKHGFPMVSATISASTVLILLFLVLA